GPRRDDEKAGSGGENARSLANISRSVVVRLSIGGRRSRAANGIRSTAQRGTGTARFRPIEGDQHRRSGGASCSAPRSGTNGHPFASTGAAGRGHGHNRSRSPVRIARASILRSEDGG